MGANRQLCEIHWSTRWLKFEGLLLITKKADVLVDLADGVFEKITKVWNSKEKRTLGWLVSDKYAAISYYDGFATGV